MQEFICEFIYCILRSKQLSAPSSTNCVLETHFLLHRALICHPAVPERSCTSFSSDCMASTSFQHPCTSTSKCCEPRNFTRAQTCRWWRSTDGRDVAWSVWSHSWSVDILGPVIVNGSGHLSLRYALHGYVCRQAPREAHDGRRAIGWASAGAWRPKPRAAFLKEKEAPAHCGRCRLPLLNVSLPPVPFPPAAHFRLEQLQLSTWQFDCAALLWCAPLNRCDNAHGMQVEVPEGTVLCFNPTCEVECYVSSAIPNRWYIFKTKKVVLKKVSGTFFSGQLS